MSRDRSPDEVTEHGQPDMDDPTPSAVHRSPSKAEHDLVTAQTGPAPDGETRSADGGMMMTDYHISIFYSEDDAGYIADIPDLESCSAFGSRPEEALAEVGRAKQAKAAQSEGKPIPPSK